MARWTPELRLKAFKIDPEEEKILVEELAEILYDHFASSENKSPGSKSNLVSTESKTNEDNNILERTGSDG